MCPVKKKKERIYCYVKYFWYLFVWEVVVPDIKSFLSAQNGSLSKMEVCLKHKKHF